MADFERAYRAMKAAGPVYFAGREGELQFLSESVFQRGARLVVVKGPAGIGKSELAREFGRRNVGLFQGGLHWMELAPEPEKTKPYAAEQVTDVQGRAFLLLEDDISYPEEHLVRSVKLLSALKPMSIILVTTCREHVIGDWVLRLGPLRLEDMKLIWGSLQVGLNAEQEQGLFRQTGGNPLAGILAGLSVRDGRTSVEEAMQYVLRSLTGAATASNGLADGSGAAETRPSPAPKGQCVGPVGSKVPTPLYLSTEPPERPGYTAETYRDELRKVEELLAIAILISESSGEIETSTRFIRATQLYTRLVATLHSFVRLLPENRSTNEREPFWDCGSVAAVARVLMEVYHSFYYIGAETIPDDEADFRLLLMHYHRNSEKYRLYKEWGATQDVLRGFEERLPLDQECLKCNKAFQRLTPKKQRALLRGKTAMHLSHGEIAARSSVLGRHFRPLYRLFSNQVHSTPFASQSQSNMRGRGFENPADRLVITLAVQVVIGYSARATLEMAELFPDQIKRAHPEALRRARELFDDFLNNCVKST
jgi:hypothetical protein